MDILPETLRQYLAARALHPSGTPVAVLHIGPTDTEVAVGQGSAPDACLRLVLGEQRTARQHFKRSLPTLLEMEEAIMTVEDEVIRAKGLVTAHPALYSADAGIHEIARLATSDDPQPLAADGSTPPTLSTDAVEACFDRLAARVQGRPSTQDSLPETAEFAARLLILREFMHHMKLTGLTVLR